MNDVLWNVAPERMDPEIRCQASLRVFSPSVDVDGAVTDQDDEQDSAPEHGHLSTGSGWFNKKESLSKQDWK